MRSVLLIVVLAMAVALGGCSDPNGSSLTEPPRTDASQASSPGLVILKDSEAEAVGTVVYRRDQGGFFAVTDISPDSEGHDPEPRLLAVLVHENGQPRVDDLAPLVGSYCRLMGSIVEPDSSTFTAPMLAFDTYHILDRP